MTVEMLEITSSIDLLSDADDHEDNSGPLASKDTEGISTAKPSVQQSTALNSTKNRQSFTALYKK